MKFLFIALVAMVTISMAVRFIPFMFFVICFFFCLQFLLELYERLPKCHPRLKFLFRRLDHRLQLVAYVLNHVLQVLALPGSPRISIDWPESVFFVHRKPNSNHFAHLPCLFFFTNSRLLTSPIIINISIILKH